MQQPARPATPTPRRWRLTAPVWLLPWLLLAAPAGPLLAQPVEEVPWSSLATHLGGELLSAEALSVADCPAGIEQQTAQRRGLQWIENSFYRWDEYDLIDGTTCLRMIEPESKVLSELEARVLLTASGRWDDPPQELLEWEDPMALGSGDLRPIEELVSLAPRASASFNGIERSLSGYPPDAEDSAAAQQEAPLDLEALLAELDAPSSLSQPSVVGVDQRQVVGNTSAVPYRHIAFIEGEASFIDYQAKKIKTGIFRATGFLISPYAILTNGHVVWDDIKRRFVRNAGVAPGLYISSGGGRRTPFGARPVERLAVSSAYTNTRQTQYDYGAMFVKKRFSGINTTMPVFINVAPQPGSLVEIAGYPRAVRGRSTHQPHTHTEKVKAVQGRILRYQVDTSGGNSGSPVMITRNGQKRAIAVHSSGDGVLPVTANSGARFVSDNEAVLLEWLRWEPQDTAGLDLFVIGAGIDNCPSLDLFVEVEDAKGDAGR